VAKWLGVKVAFPIHYRFDEGRAFVKEIQRQAPKVKPVLLKAGETYRFDKKAGSTRRPAGGK
jgi:L-ascorbate metabolism protein UlaG (beta-lactamase superfamily)